MVYASLFKPSPKTIASPGRRILAMDESSATCRERLASIGLENTEANHQAYRTCLFQLSDSGAILFEETLCQSTADSEKMVDVLVEQNIVPAPIKVAVLESWGLDNGLVSVVELEILLDGDFGIVFFYLAQNNVMFKGILLKPSMVPFANHILNRLRYFAPNPWHVSFSYARALQNTCLKKWESRPENVKEAQDVLLVWAKANSLTQLGKYTGKGWSDEAKQGMFVKGYVY
ncbi:hypothetical protein GOBAR_AA23350 [Gossypium barbadense]|uniref:fructose-bisphosphate aldolase n=1 Tax=Gossypium barbadense TaxID=3634 RepID=A0A2P5X1W4_GOSBA|nr:hypothetical protein GOBAR_AA23350 [Gossypium barbadense]